LVKNNGEIEEKMKFNSKLMVNLHKSKIKDQNKKKALKFRANVEVWKGQNCIKLKVQG